ncbi:RES family NAD+ phosphorylase [Rhodopila sp.]|uniref:RES family NAD+ phosphorylase n=1 Tax=Rhodopila sp. TaxID=2480087 RepID=UPI003D11978D
MLAWRLCRRAHADLSGEGARRFGGRWNSVGRPLVYLAEHPALAALEVRVHFDLPFELLPVDFVLMQVVVPDGPDRMFASGADSVEVGNTWLA